MTDQSMLTDLQFAILRGLWDRGSASVPDLHKALEPRLGLATSTIATVVSRLERRGVLSRERVGRQFIYKAAVAEGEIRRSMLARVVEVLFADDPGQLLAHLVRERDIK